MIPRLALTGTSGFVGAHIAHAASASWDVHALYRDTLSDLPALTKFFESHTPHSLIHSAAIADIDYCEQHPDEANASNVHLTECLAQLCKKHRTRMVYCSTDTVFDGGKGNYSEDDIPLPVNHYGHTKVRAEEVVRASLDNYAIARIALVMGLPVGDKGNAFLPKLIANARAGNATAFPANEIRTPIDVITLSRALLELAGNDFRGTMHLAGNTRLNRYEMGCQIAQQLGINTNLIQSTDSNAMPGRAPRPNDASLHNSLAREILQTPMLSLMDGLRLSKPSDLSDKSDQHTHKDTP